MSTLSYMYVSALLIPLLLASFRRFLLGLLTPRGYSGIPSYPDSKPLWGDVHRIKNAVQSGRSAVAAFDRALKDLGPIAQMRLGFIKT